MPSEGIEGDEWGAYVVLARSSVTEHGMACRTRGPRSRSANSTRGSDAPPGRTGEPCTGGSGTGGRMPRACEGREMRNAAAGLVMRRAMLARGYWRAARDRKTHEQFGEGPLEKYPYRQLAGGLLYRQSGSVGAVIRSPETWSAPRGWETKV